MNRIDLPQCPSTSDHLKALVADGALKDMTWVITPNQTSGRGQRGNTWISAPNSNISASVYKRWKSFSVAKSYLISQYIGLSLVHWLSDIGMANPQLKWPNDLFIGSKKVGGILIENGVGGKNINYSIIGVGINVFQKDFGTLSQATSLSVEGFSLDSLEGLTSHMLQHISQALMRFDLAQEVQISQAFQQKMFGRGDVHQFRHAALGLFSARVLGTDEHGQLLLEVNQQPMSFGIQEVTWVITP